MTERLIAALLPLIRKLEASQADRYIRSIGKAKTKELIAAYHEARTDMLLSRLK